MLTHFWDHRRAFRTILIRAQPCSSGLADASLKSRHFETSQAIEQRALGFCTKVMLRLKEVEEGSTNHSVVC